MKLNVYIYIPPLALKPSVLKSAVVSVPCKMFASGHHLPLNYDGTSQNAQMKDFCQNEF